MIVDSVFGPLRPLKGACAGVKVVVVQVTLTSDEAKKGVRAGDKIRHTVSGGVYSEMVWTVQAVERFHSIFGLGPVIYGLALRAADVQPGSFIKGDVLKLAPKGAS